VGSLITLGQYPVCSLSVRATKLLLLVALLATRAVADKPSETAVHRLNLILWQHDPPAEKPVLELSTAGLPTSGDPKPIIAAAADGKSVWVAAELAVPMQPCNGMDLPDCPKGWHPDNEAHASALFDGANADHPLLLHAAESISASEQAKALANKVVPNTLERRIGACAEDAVKLFESTLADPKAFAKTVSDRKDVVLYGSEQSERFVGGAKVRAALDKWHLALTVRDGVQAGATASKTVVWIAANVDARNATKPKEPATPYRMSAIYERTGDAWRVVLVHFSFSRY
jgi:hypothetical protein